LGSYSNQPPFAVIVFNINKTLCDTFNSKITNFSASVATNFKKKGYEAWGSILTHHLSEEAKNDIIKNCIKLHIKEVVEKSYISIEQALRVEFNEIDRRISNEFNGNKVELEKKDLVVGDTFWINSLEFVLEYDGLVEELEMDNLRLFGGIGGAIKLIGTFTLVLGAMAGADYYGGKSIAAIITACSNPILLVLLVVMATLGFIGVSSENPIDEIISDVKDKLVKRFNNEWYNDKKERKTSLVKIIKSQFDNNIKECGENVHKKSLESLNNILQSIEEKLQALYNEKQKSETELQMLQCNRGLICEELKFLKNEQAYLQNQLHKLYVNQV
jgi:hypothetical protein